MKLDRAAVVDENFMRRVLQGELPEDLTYLHKPLPISAAKLVELFDSQVKSRLLDFIARDLKEKGLGHYTIGSSGHEANAAWGEAFSLKDMAFLHYRSGAFFIQRAKQASAMDGAYEILLSLVASEQDKISAGRHKVFGSLELNVPPQTSTIASHLPKALGCALSITRAKELKLASSLGLDSVVLCSFGDASINHASAQTTFNACGWLAQSAYPLPIIFICEDNGRGISVKTPQGWIKKSMQHRPGLRYLEANGLDVIHCLQVAAEARHIARQQRQAVFLHMSCSRLMGHAGSDIESQYLSIADIEAQEAADPLLYTAAYLIHHGILSRQEVIDYYQTTRQALLTLADKALATRPLRSARQVMASLLPRQHTKPVCPLPTEAQRRIAFGERYPQLKLKRTLQQCLNLALVDLMLQYPQLLVFGEDVGKKGGVYRVTADLQPYFGQRRVFDTLLDETTILGCAIGFAHNGFLPMPEIQFLAYLHNAEDQLRGEAATLSFFSNGQYQNPMVIRIPSFGYQKGFGGHFHNDNSIAVLRDIPGIIIVTPSNGEDAAKLLRQSVKLAYEQGRIVIFLEPIALYMTKDLHASKDNAWQTAYPEPHEQIELGEIGVAGEGEWIIISYANGYYLSRQAAHVLKEQHGVAVKVIDLRWLAPLPMQALLAEVANAKGIVVVDECRKTGSLSEELTTRLVESLPALPKLARITGHDTFIPLGSAWRYVLPTCEQIVDKVLSMQ